MGSNDSEQHKTEGVAIELRLQSLHPVGRVAELGSRLMTMWPFLQRFLKPGAKETRAPTREELLANYPSHLALIDSREIPSTWEAGPDLSYFTESAKFYYDLICNSAPFLKDKPHAVTEQEKYMASDANNRIVSAQWGLIARGAEAIPFAIQLIQSRDRDLRESGANVFTGLRGEERAPEMLQHIMVALENEKDRLVIDSLIGALGHLKSRNSIPLLAKYIRDDTEDGDTRWGAAVSLGRIVNRRFDKDGQNAVENGKTWLDQNENKNA